VGTDKWQGSAVGREENGNRMLDAYRASKLLTARRMTAVAGNFGLARSGLFTQRAAIFFTCGGHANARKMGTFVAFGLLIHLEVSCSQFNRNGKNKRHVSDLKSGDCCTHTLMRPHHFVQLCKQM